MKGAATAAASILNVKYHAVALMVRLGKQLWLDFVF